MDTTKAYTDFAGAIRENDQGLRNYECSRQWNFTVRFVKMFAVCQTTRRSFRTEMGV
jgi:hypothetical protein